jgi:hypothetical protein
MVLNTLDSGAGSLRQAILDANANPGADTIDFNIAGAGVDTIAPLSPLPTITDTVTIDGTSQPGFAGQPIIQLNGASAGSADGLDITAAYCLVRGLVINSFAGTGIDIAGTGATGSLIQGNYIGTDATGTGALGNSADGIRIEGGAASNLIGGSLGADRNIISGNSLHGIRIRGAGTNYNMIAGNYIGTNAAGTAALGNAQRGVNLTAGASFNIIGTNADGVGDATEGNVISGNGGSGVLIFGDGTNYNVVAGNYIGTTADGESALGDGQPLGAGFLSADVFINAGPQYNQVGTSGTHGPAIDLLERNVLSGGNTSEMGVLIFDASNNNVAGNYVGTDATGTMLLGNAYSGVEIISIDRSSQNNRIGVNASDPDAAHEGNLIAGNGFTGLAADQANPGNAVGTGNYAGVSVVSATTSPINANNTIAGNLIGTNASGIPGWGNAQAGIYVNGAQGTLIGTNADGVGDALEANVISGNAQSGITIDGSLPTNTTSVAGNYIGTNAAGTAVANMGPGVQIINDSAQNTIGGSAAAAGNAIKFNSGTGVLILGTGSVDNQIRSNSIYLNGALGIDLGGDGVTPNHSGALVGPNNFQNYPVLLSAVPGFHTLVVGRLQSLPNTTYTLDFYASSSADPSGFGQGQRYLGSGTVTTNGSGKVTFHSNAFATLLGASFQNEVITATATDPGGNTSEFSAAILSTENAQAVKAMGPGTAPSSTGASQAAALRLVGGAAPGPVMFDWFFSDPELRLRETQRDDLARLIAWEMLAAGELDHDVGRL